MSTPVRIQRKRIKGWRAPEGAVYVGRGSRWGNPFVVRDKDILDRSGMTLWWGFPTVEAASAHAVKAFRWQVENHPTVTGFSVEDVRRDLAGRDLMCWCEESAPCHADALVAMAAGGATS